VARYTLTLIHFSGRPLQLAALLRHQFVLVLSSDPSTPELYTLSLHDALPIWTPPARSAPPGSRTASPSTRPSSPRWTPPAAVPRSEEHTSALESRFDIVCRLLPATKSVAPTAGRASSTSRCPCSAAMGRTPTT